VKGHIGLSLTVLVLIAGLCGCRRTEPLPEGPADAGKTVEATVEAFHFYKDRGLYTKLSTVVTRDSARFVPDKDDRGRLRRARDLSRGFAFDHVEQSEGEATVYYRTWVKPEVKARGGRPRVARLIKEDGIWKFDAAAAKRLTSAITKGRDESGLYDGTEEWWK